jgi:hypothetical protein
MSDLMFNLSLIDSSGNAEQLDRLLNAVHSLRRKTKRKSEAKRYARMEHAIRLVRVKVSQSWSRFWGWQTVRIWYHVSSSQGVVMITLNAFQILSSLNALRQEDDWMNQEYLVKCLAIGLITQHEFEIASDYLSAYLTAKQRWQL